MQYFKMGLVDQPATAENIQKNKTGKPQLPRSCASSPMTHGV
jgi:hypothetical protein